jgi:hypothetical protein
LEIAMTDPHAELSALRVEWPETPDLTEAVLAGIAQPARPRHRRPGWRPVLAYAVAAIAVAFAITMAASPDARSAVLEWLGLKSVEVERREPTAPPPRPGELGSGLGLGTPVSLAEARERLPFLSLPTAEGLGRPDAVYLGGENVSLVYGDRPGYARADTTGAALLVQEFRARVTPFIMKSVGEGARLERLRVDGAPAYFITGSHGFAYQQGASTDFEQQRLAGNTLLVERADGMLIRVEGDISRDRAVAVAQSVP